MDGKVTVKLAENSPLAVVFTVAGVVVVTAVPLNVILTVEVGSNPAPKIKIFTCVPTVPLVGSSAMVVVNEEVTLNVWEAELDS